MSAFVKGCCDAADFNPKVSGGATADQQKFYTAMYHAFSSPNVASDVNGQYMGFDLDSLNGATGSLSIGVVRAKSVGTPADAGLREVRDHARGGA